MTVSILLVAAGAILAFAVDADATGVDLNAIGWIVIAAGAAGALLSLVFWSTWGGFGSRDRVAHDNYRR